jgi:hypothetical protein
MDTTITSAVINTNETHIHYQGECYKIVRREETRAEGELLMCYTVRNKDGKYLYFYFTYSQKLFRYVTQ